MKPANSNSISYAPGEPPVDPAQLQRYLREEFAKIAAAVTGLAAGHLDPVYVAPAKPRNGDIRYADGTSWNPGSSKGLYAFNGTTWILVKAL